MNHALIWLLLFITFVITTFGDTNTTEKCGPQTTATSLTTACGSDKERSGDICLNTEHPETNGTQFNKTNLVSCSASQLGEIPDIDHMVSTIILTPQDGTTLSSNKTFEIKVRTSNMHFGFFANPDTEYFAFSQQLDTNGTIMGHQHITIQKLVDANNPPDPKVVTFFKALNNGTDPDGLLSVNMTDGLTSGVYRLCTLTASLAHQPVLMPVAQRGPQDDCVRFTVS